MMHVHTWTQTCANVDGANWGLCQCLTPGIEISKKPAILAYSVPLAYSILPKTHLKAELIARVTKTRCEEVDPKNKSATSDARAIVSAIVSPLNTCALTCAHGIYRNKKAPIKRNL